MLLFSLLFGLLIPGGVAEFRWALSKNLTPPQSQDQLLYDNGYLLVHTLQGQLSLVNRRSGVVNWTIFIDPALTVSYSGGPILLADPLDGRLYEYSNEASADVFTHLDHSIMGYVRRSPGYYKNYLSFGSKTDSWLSIDMRTGKTIRSSDHVEDARCADRLDKFFHRTTENTCSNEANDDTGMPNFLGLGQTQYNLLLRDPRTGLSKLNITYRMLSSHMEPDPQFTTFHHIATTQPSLLTFEGHKLLWNIPLSSPLVGLYTVWSPTDQNDDGSSTQPITDDPNIPPDTVEDSTQTNHNSPNFSSTPTPQLLKRIAFTTYALDMRGFPSSLLHASLEEKFSSSLNVTLSLLVSSSTAAPLYALPCVAETSLQLRGIRRPPSRFLLEGPEVVRPVSIEPHIDWNRWLLGLLGLYEFPPSQFKQWTSFGRIPLWARLPRFQRISTESTGYDVIIATGHPNSKSYPLGGFVWGSILFIIVCTSCISAAVVVICVLYVFKMKPVTSSTLENLDPGFLPAFFDLPDAQGWAGCSAQEAGQPESIRFNLNQVIGHGANGTMVFAGTYGDRQTAVKRIVRQRQLEKHWRREHAILLHHQHPNMVRCFWTGSTANFHYLVMQRCDLSLTEVFQTPTDSDPLSAWGLQPLQVIEQFSRAIAWLHRNRIVHRDLKPSNILIHSNGTESCIVVGDFGLSRPLSFGRHELTNSIGSQLTTIQLGCVTNSAGRHGSSVAYVCGSTNPPQPLDLPSGDQTSAGITCGTLGWMAPELCDPSTTGLTYAIDIFSCGLLAYHVLTRGGHPYDQYESPDLVQANSSKQASNSSTVSLPRSNKATPPGSSTAPSDELNGLSYSTAARLNRHHARQLAIAESKPPALNLLTDSIEDTFVGTLSRCLVETMLSSDPTRRPTAEEVLSYPLFWQPRKVIRFISELSDLFSKRELMDKRDEAGVTFDVPDDGEIMVEQEEKELYIDELRILMEELENYSFCVFDQHWFPRLEPDVVLDLMVRRGYQDTSLIDLLRAVRNKRSHIWNLSSCIRALFGHTYDGMAAYWTSRFPSLVPLLYHLSRCYLTGLHSMAEFLPPRGIGRVQAPSDGICDWWTTLNKPLGPDAFTSGDIDVLIDNMRASNHYRYSIASRGSPWIRGESIPSPSEVVTDLTECKSDAVGDEDDGFMTTDHVRKRRRPNQPKKVRPAKKKGQRTEYVAKANYESVPPTQID